jgi:single-strand DNA-binding protein
MELVSSQDSEVVNLDSRKKLVKFSIAINTYDHDTSGEKVTNTYWHNIIAWGKTDSFIETYIKTRFY